MWNDSDSWNRKSHSTCIETMDCIDEKEEEGEIIERQVSQVTEIKDWKVQAGAGR